MDAVPSNLLRDGLRAGRFLLTVELTTPAATRPREESLAPLMATARAVRDDPRIAAIALTDRSSADQDHDPITTGHRIAALSGKTPLVHWAGKDRTLADLERDLRRATAMGLFNFLVITGDKVRHPPPGRPVRYLDSVNALHAARRQVPGALLGAAVSPFKYREEELLGQYLKAGKKLRAGADFLMTQIGWDMAKLEEVRRVLHDKGYARPMAELLHLTYERARRLRDLRLPGVVVTPELLALLEQERHLPDGGALASLRRLALQIVGARLLGYAGCQLSGIAAYPSLDRLLTMVDTCTREFSTLETWHGAWEESLQPAGGRPVRVAPPDGFYLPDPRVPNPAASQAQPSVSERGAFAAMDLVHRAAFDSKSVFARAAGKLVQGVDARTGAGELLLGLERVTKGPLLGCATCGFCRLPATAYVCPETCPKGLANGPCGGTTDNQCEFGDRECIHARIYRVARHVGRLADLEEELIPPVPEDLRGSCSWVNHYQGRGPQTARLPQK